MFASYILWFLFFFSFSLSLPFKAPPEVRWYCLVVTHHSMEHPVPQFLEEPTRTNMKLICIGRRNFSVASCFTQVPHLQEQVFPLEEISQASLPRVNLQQSQRSTPEPAMSFTSQLPQGSSHCPRAAAQTGAAHCCPAGAPSVLQHKCTQRKSDTQHAIRMFKRWQNNAVHTEVEAVCNTTEHYPISQHCLYNNIQNRCSPALVPSTWKLHSKQGLHKLERQILYHSDFCSADWWPQS